MRVNDGLRTRGGRGPAGFVPRCPSLNPGRGEKIVDGNLIDPSTGRKREEPQRQAVWGYLNINRKQ